jgi:hypothetical protein
MTWRVAGLVMAQASEIVLPVPVSAESCSGRPSHG